MKTVAIITARGGSKRIPKKNIKDFCGKPIIAYSIEAARESGIFDEVMVSTDSEEIAAIAKSYGAAVPFLRSAAASSDTATTADVLEEVLTEYEKRGRHFDRFACIYPTAPFVTGQKLRDAAAALDGSDADGILTVMRYSYPPQRAFSIREGLVALVHPEYEKTRTQDLEPVYHDCGQFYICSAEKLLTLHRVYMPRMLPFVIPEEEAQDIDTPSDWAVAEAKFTAMQKREG